MVLESCSATQSWVNREYRRGLSPHPPRGPRVEVSMAEVLLPTLATWGRPIRKSRVQFQSEVFSPRVLSLLMRFEGPMELNAQL